MDRKLETMFDIVDSLSASTLDVVDLEKICREQQSLTMTRISRWLRSNAKIYSLGGEMAISKQISSLADEIENLASLTNA